MIQGSKIYQNHVLSITEKAKQQIERIFAAENPDPGAGLRIGVVGGGCSGLSYKIEFSMPTDRDVLLDLGGLNVCIDPKSAIYLKDVMLDYKDGLDGKGFVFSNPNAQNTCGCGESFSV